MDRIPKYKIPVRISLTEEGSVLGAIFIRQDQRIIDMLCDPNQFFPVTTNTGIFLINKSSVIKVEVLEKDFVEQNQNSFPDEDVMSDLETHAALTKRRQG